MINENKERLKEIRKILAKHDIIHGINPEKLREIIEDLGPTFVKLGQIMSMRTDMLPVAYCTELAKLRADVKPMTLEEIEEVLTSAYGSNRYDLFASFDETPLGSASMAQVHKAMLKNGELVVVKIQRQGIYEIMACDIGLLRKATSLLSFANIGGGALDFNTILDEMWQVSQQELDFLHEIRNAQEFYELNDNVDFATCPKVYSELSTREIMVMEFIDGVQIDNLEKLNNLGYDLNEIGHKLAENYAKQILEDGFFHADPHPGNIRIRDEQIVWIDMGMMGRLSTRDRQLFRKIVIAIAQDNASQLKDTLLAMGIYSDRINHSRLLQDVDDLLMKYGSTDMASLNLGELFGAIIGVANDHNISMPKGVTMFYRGILTIQGIVAELNPDISVIEIMSMQMSKDVFKNFNTSGELKDAVRSLFFSARKAIDLPANLSDILKMTIKGQTKVNLELTGSEEPLKQIDRMVNKLIICIITAALLIGSSLLCDVQIDITKFGIPTFGIVGFIVAFILSVWLLWDILRKK